MKKVMPLLLILFSMLGFSCLVACGGGSGIPSSVAGLNWDDIPVYAGAKQIQEATWAIPPTEGDWSKVEWRYYRMDDDVNEMTENVRMVTMFYKMEMPKNGWKEIEQMQTQDMSWGYYAKNNEKDGATVWIGNDDGKAVFAIMRATK